MRIRMFSLAASLLLLLSVSAQTPGVTEGPTFSSSAKNPAPDVVVDGLRTTDGRSVLFVEDGAYHKVVRLDAALRPADELSLHDVTFDGVKWQGIAPIVHDGQLHVLFHTGAKKSADYGIAAVDVNGALALSGFKRVASFEQPYLFDRSVVASRKTLPDLILFDSGIAYDERERVVRSPDGQHYLLNFYTRDTKGNKQFFFAYLDAAFEKLWGGKQELPFVDIQSDVHQVEVDNAGNILVLSYVFKCKSEGQAGDKNCHETHLSIIGQNGTAVKDLLVDKDFVSSARIRPLADGKVMVAVRYGALTGLPGQVVTIDPADAKLKPTPLVDQRTPNVKHLKLLAFGVPAAEGAPKKTGGPKTGAKVPDEIIDLVPAWDGGTLLLEAYRDDAHQIPINEGAVAVRHLYGAIRATYLNAKDSMLWQHDVDRGLFTTAGDLFGAFAWTVGPDALTLVYGSTPGGEAAVLREATEAMDEDGKKKKDKDAPKTVEHSELRITAIGKDGKPTADKAVIADMSGLQPRLTATVADASGERLLLECFDMERTHRYVQLDLGALSTP